MKTLYLLRHAKSSWDDDQLNDAERPLTRRGKRDCGLVAHQLERNHKKFQQVFCSSANRCQETLQRFRTESDVFDHAEIHTTEDLYTFDMQQLLTWLKELGNQYDNALIIGHNPALLDLVNYLYDGKLDQLGTCTFVELEINVEYWDQLRPDSAKLQDLIRPKQLR